MDKILAIDGKEVGLRATALTPRIYRHKIGRDIIQDLNRLQKNFARVTAGQSGQTEEEQQEAQLSALDLEIFENTAFVMARQYDPSIPATPEEWLDGFQTFSIYEILPEVLELWAFNSRTTAKPKKK